MITAILVILLAAGIVLVFLRPQTVLLLIPPVIFLPRTLPRLFGTIGAMELTLPLFAFAWICRSLVFRKKIFVDTSFWIMALILVSRLLAMFVADGETEATRVVLVTWISCLAVYLMAMNLCDERWTPLRNLKWGTILPTVVVLFDVLFLSRVARGEVTYDDALYRQQVSSIGQGQTVAVHLLASAPVSVVLMLCSQYRKTRTLWWLVLVGAALPGYISLTRAAAVSVLVALVTAVVLVPPRVRRRAAVVLMLTAALLVTALGTWRPYIMTDFQQRFEWRRMSDLGGRIEVWETQLPSILAHPLFGVGVYSIQESLQRGILSRHGFFTDSLYHYGLVLSLPVLVWLWHLFGRSYTAYRMTRGRDVNGFSIIMLASVLNVIVTAVANSYLEFDVTYSLYISHIFGLEGAFLARLRHESCLPHEMGEA